MDELDRRKQEHLPSDLQIQHLVIKGVRDPQYCFNKNIE